MSAGGVRRVAAFAAIYLIWGSTYLAIRYAVETLPPFFMMGCRSLLAGALLYAWARLRGCGPALPGQWPAAALVGALLFAGGHGALAWGEQSVPSGLAALMMATIPIWMTLLQVLGRRRVALSGRAILGLVLGVCGVALLAEPAEILGGAPVEPIGAVVLLLGALSWSIGSVYSRNARLPDSSTMTAGMTLIAGGALLLLASVLAGEEAALASVSLLSLVSLAYLVAFGSIVAFAAYIWLMKVSSPARVSTYAFVNPAVAVLVGWLVEGEPLGPRVLAAALVMVTGVAAIVTGIRAPGAYPGKEPCGSTSALEGSRLRTQA